MNVGLIIGGLGSGGAERQLIRLACGLHERGVSVHVLTVSGGPCDIPEFGEKRIRHRRLNLRGPLEKLRQCRLWLKESELDVIHGFMYRSSALACLAGTKRLVSAVVATDFSTATYNSSNRMFRLATLAFARADAVVTQTSLNRDSMERLAPWLRGKINIIRNGVDSRRFCPPTSRREKGPFLFAVVSTVSRIKNPVRMVHAVAALKAMTNRPFKVSWFGRYGFKGDNQPTREWYIAQEERKRLNVEDEIAFFGETSCIEEVYQQADALVHPSIQEGFPNAVVEAMACGLPIVVGHISDLPLVVKNAQNGFLFDQTDPDDIAKAMLKMINTSARERKGMSERSRELAINWFGKERFIDDYLSLYRRLTT